jgi:hypothetical protein
MEDTHSCDHSQKHLGPGHSLHVKDVKIDIKCYTKLISEMMVERNLETFYQLKVSHEGKKLMYII